MHDFLVAAALGLALLPGVRILLKPAVFRELTARPWLGSVQIDTGNIAVRRIHFLAPGLAFCLAAFAASAAEPVTAAGPEQVVFPSLDGPIVADRLITGLSQPSAIEFLPNGKALVMQRFVGLLSLVDFASGAVSNVEGMSNTLVSESGGAHDIELHPDFAVNGWVYISYSEGKQGQSSTVVDRIRLDGVQVVAQERIFAADAYPEPAYEFLARMAFVEGYLFLALADRRVSMAQDNSNHAGTIVRLHDDGRVPADNPLAGAVAEEGKPPPKPEIWSYGHRNPQGLYRHPQTGELWACEHGPRGGDELNQVKKGANYGWPVVSFGLQYGGGAIGAGIPVQAGMANPAWVYVPSIAPGDLVIYQGEALPHWQGNFLIGALAGMHLNRLVMRDGQVVAEERMAHGLLGRIRALALDPAGRVYLANDYGEIWRLRPQEPQHDRTLKENAK
jgi:aldose sugar dehydrogenase